MYYNMYFNTFEVSMVWSVLLLIIYLDGAVVWMLLVGGGKKFCSVIGDPARTYSEAHKLT